MPEKGGGSGTINGFFLLGRNVCSVRKLMFNVAERANRMNRHLKQRPMGRKLGKRQVSCRKRRGGYFN